MAVIRCQSGNGGGSGSLYDTDTVASGATKHISTGFYPKHILIYFTQQNQSGHYVYLYDEDYNSGKIRYSGANDKGWSGDMDVGAGNVTIANIGATGFDLVNNGLYSSGSCTYYLIASAD